jgi:hypothetical protein
MEEDWGHEPQELRPLPPQNSGELSISDSRVHHSRRGENRSGLDHKSDPQLPRKQPRRSPRLRELWRRKFAHGTQDANLYPTMLTPRMSGAFILNTNIGCVPGGDPHRALHTYSGIVIVLPHDAGEVRVSDAPLYMPCDLGVSQLGWSPGFQFN